MLQVPALGQETLRQTTLWNRIYVKKSIKEGQSINFLGENRQYISPWRAHMTYGELSYHRKVGKSTSAALLTTYLTFALPHDPDVKDTKRLDELRFHQSLTQRLLKKGNHQLVVRFMLEERFFLREQEDGGMADHFDFTYWRFRTRFRYSLGLTENLSFLFSEEVHIQANESLNVKFDQSRTDMILRYRVNKNVAIDGGYLLWYQERSTVNYLRHSIRTGLFISI